MTKPFRIATLAAALIVCSCGTVVPPEPPVTTTMVDVAVPKSCPVTLAPAPAYSDTQAALDATTDIYAAVQLLLAGRKLRIQREADLTADLQTCSAAPAPAAP
jgi:hypothetical protein